MLVSARPQAGTLITIHTRPGAATHPETGHQSRRDAPVGQQLPPRTTWVLLELRISRNLSRLTASVKSARHQRRGINRSGLCLRQQQQQQRQQQWRQWWQQDMCQLSGLFLHRRHREKLERRHNTECGGSYFIENNYHGGTYCTGAVHAIIDSCDTQAGEL